MVEQFTQFKDLVFPKKNKNKKIKIQFQRICVVGIEFKLSTCG